MVIDDVLASKLIKLGFVRSRSKHNKPNIVPSSLLNRISLVASK
jgi:hypothetical protein